jgi:hypothetical protein
LHELPWLGKRYRYEICSLGKHGLGYNETSYSSSHNRTPRIQSSHDTITSPCSKNTHAQRLHRTIQARFRRPDGKVVLDEAKDKEDDDRDAGGDEEGVCYVGHGEVGEHGD